MGLDNATLFVANIVILLVSVAAYLGVWLRSPADRHWLSWITANFALAAGLVLYLTAPDLPPHLAVWPDAFLIAGFSLRLAAARQFGGRSIQSPMVWAPAPAFIVLALLSSDRAANYSAANVVLTAQAFLVAYEFWRDRQDGLLSRVGLIGAYGVMAISFGARAFQGLVAADQISSYIPYDTLLEVHLVVALFHLATGTLLVLSLAAERTTDALRQAAMIDPLTGLNNRRAFDAYLRSKLASGSGQFALVLFDIDHFKRVNDRHGHAAGDAVLKSIADLLLHGTGKGDFVARIGGEEFALILSGLDTDQAFEATEHLRKSITGADITHDGVAIQVTASAGICHSTEGHTYDGLLEAADHQLYRAKRRGRNRTYRRTSRKGDEINGLLPESSGAVATNRLPVQRLLQGRSR
ncbi:MAG TPA: GGDEF domain-containing protein [Pseudorhizobium sp.]|jgi:diguanylate cyclase (GGDEF)-like protein|nr:GGDEF domain-containing protein [Pseudorhizobium sp.]